MKKSELRKMLKYYKNDRDNIRGQLQKSRKDLEETLNKFNSVTENLFGLLDQAGINIEYDYEKKEYKLSDQKIAEKNTTSASNARYWENRFWDVNDAYTNALAKKDETIAALRKDFERVYVASNEWKDRYYELMKSQEEKEFEETATDNQPENTNEDELRRQIKFWKDYYYNTIRLARNKEKELISDIDRLNYRIGKMKREYEDELKRVYKKN